MKNLNPRIKSLACLIFTILIGLLFLHPENSSELIKNASAKQAFKKALDPNDLNLVDISPEGDRVAFLDEQGAIILRDVASGETLWFHFDQQNDVVTGLSFGQGGKILASAGKNAINLWDAELGQVSLSIPLLNSSSAIVKLAYSPDGKRVAVVNQNNDIFLWNLEPSAPRSIQLGQGVNAEALEFSPDGKFLVGITGDQASSLWLWNAETGRLRSQLAPNMLVSDIAFSSDSKLLAFAGQSGRLYFWDANSGVVTRTIETNEEVTSLAFSPDSKILASGSKGNDPKIKFWNTQTGSLEFSRQTEGGVAVTGLFFDNNGSHLASVGKDNQIGIWGFPNGELQQLLKGYKNSIDKVAFNAGQDMLAAIGKDGLTVWDLSSGSVKQGFQIPVFANSSLLASQGQLSKGSVSNVPPATSQPSGLNAGKVAANPTVSSGVAESANQKKLIKFKKRSAKPWKGIKALAISADGTEMGAGSVDGTVRVFKRNGKERWKIAGHHGRAIAGVGFRSKAKQWVTIGVDTEIKIWDDLGNNVKTFYGPEHPPKTVAVSSDGRFIAVAGEDTRIFLYDAVAGKLSQVFYGHKDFINGLAFSPDGKTLVSAGSEGQVLVWDVPTAKLKQTLLGHTNEVTAVAISPDGGLMASASADATIILWNLTTGSKVNTLTGHQGAVRSVAFSPNNKKLVSTGDDGRTLVWNPATGQLRRQLAGAPAAVNALAFDPQGNLHSASESGELSEYNTDNGDKVETLSVPISSAPEPQSSNSWGAFSQSVNASSRVDDKRLSGKNENSSLAAVSAIATKLLDWLIPVANADPNQGAGGPILVITPSATSGFGHYYAEILRTEGLTEFAVTPIGSVTAATLNSYDVVILSEMSLTASQVSMFTTWVNNGGNLIAMRPDSQLASLLGLTSVGTTLANGYLLVDTSASPGSGIVGQTIQYHGVADRYTLSGATSIATLYSNATTATANPAVTLRPVGSAGGQAAAFTYDLARSVIYTRQGNPAWPGQNRDRAVSSVAAAVIRSNDLYYGADPLDNQPDWIDFNKVMIPQADEQQRLLANLIIEMNRDRKPLPRFWYFPAGVTSVVLMTGDDHANGGTVGRWNSYISSSTPGCSVQNWECIRGTSYVYLGAVTQTQATNFNSQGFEVGLHINTGCTDFTPASLEANYAQQIADFNAAFGSAFPPVTMRHHCLVWSDWANGVKTQINHGIRLDTSYYFWPPEWVLDRPGLFTGSAMPMRFADADGSLIDGYQATSQMTDESGQTYPFTIDSLLAKAVGAEGYYGVYNVNAHTDSATNPVSDAVIAAAVSRGMPVVTSKQVLNWLDFRNDATFSGMTWGGNTLSFTVTPAGTGSANVPVDRLQVLLPKKASGGLVLSGITRSGSPVTYSNTNIKGVDYAAFSNSTTVSSSYVATYAADTTAPTVTTRSPAVGATGVSTSVAVTVTFSESIDPATITASTFELRNPNNSVVPSTVSYNPSTLTATLTPNSSLALSTVYTVTVKGGTTAPQVKDLAGNPLAANVVWSFTTAGQVCSSSCSAWSDSTVPSTPSFSDNGAIELGVKFRADVAGYVTGVRFYKGSLNTGTHIGNLWTASGTRLATATFSSETATGWQQVTFASPVAVQANTTYIVSYYAPNGGYALSNSPEFSTQGVDNPPIHLLMSGVDGGNGVYTYSSSSAFPISTFNSSNYWVDVLFTTTSGPDTTAPTVTAQSPGAGATGIATNSALTATFSEPMDAATVTSSTFELRNTATSALVTATVSYNATTNTATLTPSASLSATTQYTATIKGGTADPRVKDLAGNALASNFTWNFTTGAAGGTGCSGGTNSIWPANPTPTTLQDPDTNPVELGVKFRSSVNGYICGIRFYKGTNNTGTHVGKLWNVSGGTPLATATFTNETATGWQQVNFASPVAITANTVYVASYYAPNGRYSTNNNYFTAGVTSGSLYALADGENGGNGVYGYLAGGGFPANTYQKENYWVDVLFTTTIGPDTTAPTVTAQSPGAGATGIATNSALTATFSEPMDAATVTSSTFELRNTATSALVTATVSYNATTNTATLTPSASLSATTQYTATIKGGTADPRVKDLAGNALASNFTWNFTTGAAGGTGCSGGTSTIWPSTTVPAISADSDTASVELGVKFRANQNGYICGVRFYKDSTNTGTHVGKLWSSTGTLLASATFQNETASGWQQVNFSSPVQIVSGTQYIASYLAPAGRYSVNGNYFSAGVTNGSLYAFSSAESGGNGVYLYGAGGFPVNTYQAANYWVDVSFTTSLGPDTTAPTVGSTLPASNATGVVPSSPIAVTFSEPMDAATITSSTFELRNTATSALVTATVSYNAATNTATLTPSASLAASTQYTARVIGGTGGVKDVAGNALAATYTWQFTTGADPCSTGGNAIVCENSLPGNPPSEWDISGAGDLSIQGYATEISVNRGQTVNFKVDTPSTNYRLDIYRLGYYGGNGARLVATVQPSAFPIQPACFNHAATGLIDCGNWSVTASWAVPSNATSGIYVAKATREDGANTGASHIVFIVRDDASTSDILFQTSDTTWQAYNDYAGNSLYGGSGPGGGLSGVGRAYKVSYNRPFNTRVVDNGQDWLFNAEYPMVRWLEANGYNVSYTTGVDSDRFGSLIRNHKLFMSNAHDEYWSGQQRANVEAARDAVTNPVNLAFFSGNEVFWKTRWENNIINSSGTLGTNGYRTLVCYKETHAGAKIDPLPNTWTGTWRDPRFSPPADGGRPESALLGNIFMVNDGATTNITVPQADGQMRFWRGTSIANLAANGTATLPNSTLGYEWDVDLDNGFRPAGVVRLSTTIVPNAPILTDYGSTFGSGLANHALTLYKAASGAKVFGAGTVQWAWGLDSNHDRGNTPASVDMQQATVNLFYDMGVQPGTIQAGLSLITLPNDSTAPTSVITSPTAGATIPLNSLVVISGTASDIGGKVGGVEVSVDGGLTWHPASGRTSWTYSWNTPSVSGSVNIKTRAVDDSLNLEAPGAGITVNVGSGSDGTPPTVSMTAPANGATVTGTAVTVSANASDNVGVTSVQFLLDGASLGSPDTAAPYSMAWNSTTASNGSHTLSARASDAAGNNTTATSVSVTVSNGVVANTGLLSPTANAAVTSGSGDNNGFETTPTNAYADGGGVALDTNSGTNTTNTSCTNSGKDRHIYSNYNINLPVGATIRGVEVRLDARVDTTLLVAASQMCVDISWNGGTTWTTTKSTTNLTTTEATYMLGSATDTWGRTWTVSDFTNANFRIRILNRSASTARDFSLDWAAVRITYQ